MKYEEAKEKFIQAWGTIGSSWGINRTMAQIHALLLISSKPLSTEEIMEQLKISRGNANMNLRALMEWGIVHKELVPGERKEFFVAEKDIWQLGQQIARERKKKELEPLRKFLIQIQEVEGENKEVEEFKKITSDINNFSAQAENLLDMYINSKQNWLFKAISKLKI